MNTLMEAEEKLGGRREVGSQGGRSAAAQGGRTAVTRPPGGQLGGREGGGGGRQQRGLREAAWERGTALAKGVGMGRGRPVST